MLWGCLSAARGRRPNGLPWHRRTVPFRLAILCAKIRVARSANASLGRWGVYGFASLAIASNCRGRGRFYMIEPRDIRSRPSLIAMPILIGYYRAYPFRERYGKFLVMDVGQNWHMRAEGAAG
jgi:hypothetical protein